MTYDEVNAMAKLCGMRVEFQPTVTPKPVSVHAHFGTNAHYVIPIADFEAIVMAERERCMAIVWKELQRSQDDRDYPGDDDISEILGGMWGRIKKGVQP